MVCLVETWSEGKECEKKFIEREMKEFEVEMVNARRTGERRRARGEIIMATKKRTAEWKAR